VTSIRRQFREANGISENSYTIFIAPGNEKKEV
jgi:hypothetical protein